MKDFLFTFIIGFVVLFIMGVILHCYDVFSQSPIKKETLGGILAVLFSIGLIFFVGFITREFFNI